MRQSCVYSKASGCVVVVIGFRLADSKVLIEMLSGDSAVNLDRLSRLVFSGSSSNCCVDWDRTASPGISGGGELTATAGRIDVSAAGLSTGGGSSFDGFFFFKTFSIRFFLASSPRHVWKSDTSLMHNTMFGNSSLTIDFKIIV